MTGETDNWMERRDTRREIRYAEMACGKWGARQGLERGRK